VHNVSIYSGISPKKILGKGSILSLGLVDMQFLGQVFVLEDVSVNDCRINGKYLYSQLRVSFKLPGEFKKKS
jgi:hypothetical protein